VISEGLTRLTKKDYKAAALLLKNEEMVKSFSEETTHHIEEYRPIVERIVPIDKMKRWPNGVVPYTMEGNGVFDTINGVTGDMFRETIAAAILELGRKTCVQWKEKTDADEDWVHFMSTEIMDRCSTSPLGYHEGYHEKFGMPHSIELHANCNHKVLSSQQLK
jgi:hypothetical protein